MELYEQCLKLTNDMPADMVLSGFDLNKEA
jgi:hypothetical protein